LIPFRLRVAGTHAEVEVLDDRYLAFEEFLHGVFGREGLEEQAQIARAVAAGDYTESRGGIACRCDTYECNLNYHHILVTRSTVTVERLDDGPRAEASTDDWVAFLEEILRELDTTRG